MPVARPESSDARVVAHVDMDCFYVQVEQRKRPELRGQPTAVVQYNEWKGGALIAVGYEARKCGVKRHMRGDEAKEVCPSIHLVQVPVARSKADLSTYRAAGSEVVSVLSRKGRCERASIDEVYLDLTEAAETMLVEAPPESLAEMEDEVLKSHVLGLSVEEGGDSRKSVKEWLCRRDADYRDKLLACGVMIVTELRMQVLKDTEFTCSAGIAHNKMLAKLASGMNKPAQQTVVPLSSVQGLLNCLPVNKMKQLGGKLGVSVQNDLCVNTVGDLLQFSEERLQKLYGTNSGTWLWNIARGISGEEVQERLLPKSHGSGKLFPGPRALKTLSAVQHWLNQLCEELDERLCSDLEQNKRIASTLTLHANAYKSSDTDSHKKFPSKSCPLRYGALKIQEDAFNLFQAALREYMGLCGIKTSGNKHGAWGITSLSVSASKIVAIPAGTSSILNYFHGKSSSCSASKQLMDNHMLENSAMPLSGSESCAELKSVEAPNELPQEEDSSMNTVSGLSKEEEIDAWKDRVSSSDISCSLTSKAPDVQPESLTALTLSEVPKKGPPIKKGKEKRRKISNDKIQGVPSLLNFFKNYNAAESSLLVTHAGITEESGSPSSGGPPGRYLEPVAGDPDELHDRDSLTDHHLYSCNEKTGQNDETSERWSYKINEIDPSVISELPPEIQHEIRTWSSDTSSYRRISDCTEINQNEPPQEHPEPNCSSSSSCGMEDRRQTSNYRIDEIDPSVFDELPPEIQKEIRISLRPRKRPNMAKGGSTIAHYFLPTRNE